MLETEIRERIDLMRMQVSAMDRRRIRAVMNGGAEGVRAVLAWGEDGPYSDSEGLGIDLPTANFMYSGLERQAQRIGRMPTIKTDMIPSKDTSIARKKAEKRARIVRGWDDTQRLELHFPQMGRWVPGYGFSVHVITEREVGNTMIPVAEMRDPFDTFLGWFGPDQQPQEMCVVRRIPVKILKDMYPEVQIKEGTGRKFGTGPYIFGESNWERGSGYSQDTTEIIEYINIDGTYMILPEQGNQIVSHTPNPLMSGPGFVVTKRFSFDQLQSQYHHVFGLMAMLGKLNLLGLMATEDANFRETNIFGEMDSTEYEKGRDAINFLQPGARVEKPTGEQVNQSWQAVNILERQFRVVAGYDVQQDGQSPNSFATGAGMETLQGSADNTVREYQTAIKHSVELIDRKRLEWEDVMHPTAKKKVYWYEGSKDFEETYTPDVDIAGDYRTERVYGAMATFDETSKILAGIQLLGARVIDTRTLQEELDGFRNVSLINERIVQDQTRDALLASLGQKSAQQDPLADQLLYEIFKNPSDLEEILGGVFSEEAMAAAQQEQLVAAQQGAGPGGPPALPQDAGPGEGGPPQSVQSILSLIEGEGGGVQSVSRV